MNAIRYPRKLLRPDRDKFKEPMTKFQRNAFVDLTPTAYITFVTVSTRFTVSIVRVTPLLCEPDIFVFVSKYYSAVRRSTPAKFPVKLFFFVTVHVMSSGKACLISNHKRHPKGASRGREDQNFSDEIVFTPYLLPVSNCLMSIHVFLMPLVRA